MKRKRFTKPSTARQLRRNTKSGAPIPAHSRAQLLAVIAFIRKHDCGHDDCHLDHWAQDGRWAQWRERVKVTSDPAEFRHYAQFIQQIQRLEATEFVDYVKQ